MDFLNNTGFKKNYFTGIHENNGSDQLAALECLVPHVLPFPLHLRFLCHLALLCPGMFYLPVLASSFCNVVYPVLS